MSLLLDALKKAEKAKDEAKRRAQLADGADTDDTVAQVRTRNELPDISRPLEMRADEAPTGLEPSAGSPVPDAFSTAPTTRPQQEPAVSAPRAERSVSENQRTTQSKQTREADSGASSAQRAAAKNVFEAKFREPNPKLPFYITLAVLGAFAIGTVIYFWYQLRPPPPLVNTNPKPPADEKKSEPLQVPPSEKPVATDVPNSAGAIPGLPAQAPAAAESAPAQVQPRAAGVSPVNPSPGAGLPSKPGAIGQSPTANVTAAPRAAPARNRESGPSREQGAASTASATPDRSRLSVSRGAPEVNPKIEAGWIAYNQGDLKAARSHYQDMLREEPANRDALLGMAAVEVRANRLEQAATYYQNVLQINPRDPYAQVGLLALRAQVSDPVQTESRVKNLLASDPEAQVLYFSLGNQYAQQERWPEAQQAYFRAYSAEPENPDFAYNLAVSLDHVRQPKLALEYYRRALSLAQQRPSNFDQNLARGRVQELTR